MAAKPMFTQKHFVWFAGVIDNLREVDDILANDMAKYMANQFATTNPLFKRDTFLAACGVVNGSDNTSVSPN